MNLTLESLVDEMLNVDIPETRPTFLNRIHNIIRRRDIEKQMQDEREEEELKILRLGEAAEGFLASSYYRDLIDPQIRQAVKGGIQKLIKDGDNMTEAQLKCELAVIRKSLSILASVKLKVIQAKLLKEKK